MKTPLRITLVLAVAGLVAATVALKKTQGPAPAAPVVAGHPAPSPAARQRLPRLVDLGAGKCIPCKMMAPILEELKKEYTGIFEVEFIDVWQNPDAGKPYGVDVIPTQIFIDATGQERFRHTGFYGKKEILAKWKELGVSLSGDR